MILIADADLWDPVIRSLQAVRFPIARLSELGIPLRPDSTVMQGVLDHNGMLITRDVGVPSQAYLYQFGAKGITVVVVRLKPENPTAWQRTVEVVLRHWDGWQQTAATGPSLITVNWNAVRARQWATLPPATGNSAMRRHGPEG